MQEVDKRMLFSRDFEQVEMKNRGISVSKGRCNERRN